VTKPPAVSELPAVSQASAMSRRDALGTSAGLVVGAAIEATLAGCRSEPAPAAASEPATQPAAAVTASEPGRFSPEQRAILDGIVDFLIPDTTSPGARQAEVPAFIEGVVLAVLEDAERRAFCDGLHAVAASAQQKHGLPFVICSPQVRLELVRSLFGPEEATRAFARRVRELTISGFCKSRFGATRVLQYDPIPGAYDGCRSLESVGRAWATS
jgi:gluconate 2-dehydrogenase gamma chain